MRDNPCLFQQGQIFLVPTCTSQSPAFKTGTGAHHINSLKFGVHYLSVGSYLSRPNSLCEKTSWKPPGGLRDFWSSYLLHRTGSKLYFIISITQTPICNHNSTTSCKNTLISEKLWLHMLLTFCCNANDRQLHSVQFKYTCYLNFTAN